LGLRFRLRASNTSASLPAKDFTPYGAIAPDAGFPLIATRAPQANFCRLSVNKETHMNVPYRTECIPRKFVLKRFYELRSAE